MRILQEQLPYFVSQGERKLNLSIGHKKNLSSIKWLLEKNCKFHHLLMQKITKFIIKQLSKKCKFYQMIAKKSQHLSNDHTKLSQILSNNHAQKNVYFIKRSQEKIANFIKWLQGKKNHDIQFATKLLIWMQNLKMFCFIGIIKFH